MGAMEANWRQKYKKYSKKVAKKFGGYKKVRFFAARLREKRESVSSLKRL